MTPWRWLVAPLVLALAACSAETAETDSRVRAARIEMVSAADAPVRRDFVGRVEARLTVDLAFQVGGRLANFPISEGEILEEGALVARLETQDFERALREARVQLQQATQNLDRTRTLHERGIASEAALEEAQTAHDLRAVALDNARQNLAYATVEAPFEGLVARRLVDNFTTVAPGQPVARLQDVSELRVAISVPESLIATIDQNAARVVEARFPFLPGRSFPLEYRELISEPDQASQTYRVIFALPDDIPANVLPGMTASVSVTIDPSGDPALAGVRAPVSALAATPDGGFRVWVYDPATGEVSPRAVTTGAVSGDSVLVAEGLTPGERIVTAGVNALHEGMRVRPLDATARYDGEG
ncbi:efflux RND transporter periplasmic adaptor subunit [Marinicauda salina]|uniref:Efflux RND transporter periplasmic adaptor subunit n=1 Tax=Marinicauda salina TaxID=2135793 RepID=A0A2U2BVQ8_9PROT|nr:efflux RND transporter periplasmic adaptor subunit [Marinicauda salina]PWE18098.1 efflux RND transporter periplasmic adaptor subunit [Marinicauda salina]